MSSLNHITGTENGKRVFLVNLGCKVNAYETDAMGELLAAAGYRLVQEEAAADYVIVNTCTVTNIADRKSRQMLHRAKRLNPAAVVVACGCYVETASEPVDGVDILVGNNRKKEIVQILADHEAARAQADASAQEQASAQAAVYMSDLKEYEELEISATTEHTRAFLKVQDGCNQFCSYCAIPLARGRVRSRAKDDVVAEVRRLAAHGYKEVVLTGIHLSSYGTEHGFGSGRMHIRQEGQADPMHPGDYAAEESALLQLIRAVHAVDGIERIRLGSLEPRIVTVEFMEGLAALPKVCPHFHLSLQSGCEKTLRAMNRRYSAEEYAAACARIRAVWPLAAICTDVIVGFPGETDEDFEESYRFIEGMQFYETHIFKYSRRRGTRADRMPDQVPDQIKTERSSRLFKLHERQRKRYAEQFARREILVLVEEDNIGHSMEYLHCRLLSDTVYPQGSVVRCVVTDCAERSEYSVRTPKKTENSDKKRAEALLIPCKTL